MYLDSSKNGIVAMFEDIIQSCVRIGGRQVMFQKIVDLLVIGC